MASESGTPLPVVSIQIAEPPCKQDGVRARARASVRTGPPGPHAPSQRRALATNVPVCTHASATSARIREGHLRSARQALARAQSARQLMRARYLKRTTKPKPTAAWTGFRLIRALLAIQLQPRHALLRCWSARARTNEEARAWLKKRVSLRLMEVVCSHVRRVAVALACARKCVSNLSQLSCPPFVRHVKLLRCVRACAQESIRVSAGSICVSAGSIRVSAGSRCVSAGAARASLLVRAHQGACKCMPAETCFANRSVLDPQNQVAHDEEQLMSLAPRATSCKCKDEIEEVATCAWRTQARAWRAAASDGGGSLSTAASTVSCRARAHTKTQTRAHTP
eukprot:2787039-Pleurochrysis_carterae.AAC.1